MIIKLTLHITLQINFMTETYDIQLYVLWKLKLFSKIKINHLFQCYFIGLIILLKYKNRYKNANDRTYN